MNIRAREEGPPLGWTSEAATSWATVCRLYSMLLTHIRGFTRREFAAFSLGGASAFSPREFFEKALDRAIQNIDKPALPNRKPIHCIADTFALGSVSYRGAKSSPDPYVEAFFQEPLITWMVTDEHIHKAALYAVMSEDGFWEACLEDFAKKRPGWLRRTFSDANKWLFPDK